MKSLYPLVLILIIFSTLTTQTWAQRQTFVGLDAIGEWSDATFQPGIGAVVERKFTKHSGLESGLFYKNYNWNGIITISTGNSFFSSAFRVAEHYLSVPVLYKYYTRLVNVSIGPTFDYYTGFTHKNKTSTFNIDSYDINPRLSLGLLLKVSKSFPLNKQLHLEPALRLSANISYERLFSGLGVALKYKLD